LTTATEACLLLPHVAANLMAEDPVLGMVRDGGRWWIEHKLGGERFGFPVDDDQPRDCDVAYLARHHYCDAVRVHELMERMGHSSSRLALGRIAGS
jgi:hypothetical protein